MQKRDGDTAPLCECGCGEPVRTRDKGIWSRWRPGHSRRRPLDATLPWDGRRGDIVDPVPSSPGRDRVGTVIETWRGERVLVDPDQLRLFE